MADDIQKKLKSIRLIEQKEAKFEEYIRSTTPKIADQFKKLLRGLPTKSVKKIDADGNDVYVTVIDAANEDYYKFLAELPNKLQSTLKKVGYTDKAADLTELYGNLEGEYIELHNDLSKIKSNKKVFSQAQTRLNFVRQMMIDATIDSLTKTEIEAAILPEIRTALNNAALGEASLFDTIDSIGDTLAGDGEVDGIFARNATRIARDSFYQYQGLINQTIANEFEMNAYRYIGSLVEESREQCVRWSEQEYILFSDLQDEIDWAFDNGSGMIKWTTPDTFATYRGGWNCRHLAIPVFYSPEQTEETTP